jgi:saccharopine dehydrogenase-like NADP-dependent oxidoreductase
MQQILVLGAGKSAPYLIHYLLEHAEEMNWTVTVGDLKLEEAERAIAGHPRGRAIAFDMRDTAQIGREFQQADMVASMLAPTFQEAVARACLEHGCHMVSVSYTNPAVRAMDDQVREKGLLFINELGLDPGIDHMSAAKAIAEIRAGGGHVMGFKSYGSGVPAPESIDNPLQYVITWNPQNVARAGSAGAIYRYMGQTKIVPAHRVFNHTWPVSVDGVGLMEAYPNRDSLEYLDAFALKDTRTMIRATLRYPGYSETWHQIVALGLNNSTIRIPDLQKKSYRDVVKMFLPLEDRGKHVEMRVAKVLGINPTGAAIRNLSWLGLFSRDLVRTQGDTAADMLTDLLLEKLPLREGRRDMVILLHEFDVEYPAGLRGPDPCYTKELHTMVHTGELGGFTAMARTVGMPAGICLKLIAQGAIEDRGCVIPRMPAIYEPALAELESAGIFFTKKVLDPSRVEDPLR